MTKPFLRSLVSAFAYMLFVFIGASPAWAQTPVVPLSIDPDPITMTAVSCIGNGGRSLLASGTFQLQIVDGNGTPAILGTGDSLQVTTSTLTEAITTGSFANITIPNPANTTLTPYFLHLTVVDKITNKITNYPKVQVMLNDVPVAGRFTQFNFCKANTTLATGATPVTYVIGPPGTAGPNCSVLSPSGYCYLGTTELDAGALAAGSTTPTRIGNTGVQYPDGSTQSSAPKWGSIAGTLSTQSDLQTALTGKAASNASALVNGISCVLGSSCTVAGTPLNPRGAYSSVATYAAGDLVSNSGSVWACITGCSAVTPVAGANWMLVSTVSGATSTQITTILSKAQVGQNLFNVATLTSGFFINGTTGGTSASAAFYASDYIPVLPGTTLVANVLIGATSAGYAFYDISQTFISGANGNVSAGTTITVPSTAVYFRYSGRIATQATDMLCVGSTTPTGYVPYSFAGNAATAAAIAVQAVYSSLPSTRNLFDKSAVTTGHYLSSAGVSTVSASFHISPYIPIVPGTTYVLSQAIPGSGGGGAFYDLYGNIVLANTPPLGSAAGTNITAPANAVTFRFCENNAVLNTQTLTIGTTAPSTYIPFSWGITLGDSVVATAALSAVQSLYQSLPSSRNLFDKTAITAGYYLSNLGVPIVQSSYHISGYIPVIPGTTYVFSQAFGGSGGGGAFYDASGTLLLANTPLLTGGAGTTVTAPAGAVSFRFPENNSVLNTQTMTIGTVAPSTYVAFGWSGSTTATEAAASATNGKNICFFGDSITQLIYFSYWGSTVLSRLGMNQACMDARSGRRTIDQFEVYGGFIPYPALNGTLSTYSLTSNVLTANGTYPVAYPSGTRVKFTGLTVGTYLLPLECTINSGATTSTFTASCTAAGVAWTNADITSTSDSGTVIPTLANGTMSSFSITSNVLAVVGSFPAYPAGTIVAFAGQTVGTYLISNTTTILQCTVITGATTTGFSANCVANGSAWTHANVTSTSDTGIVISPGHNLGCVYIDSTHKECQGTPGNTFGQDLRAAAPDVLNVFLGTNDASVTAGSPTDVAGAATEYGSIKAVIEATLAADPSVHMVWITPYLKAKSAVVAIIKIATAQYGVPTFDTMDNTLMDTTFTWTTLLAADHVHPSSTGGYYLGGVIAEFIKANY